MLLFFSVVFVLFSVRQGTGRKDVDISIFCLLSGFLCGVI